MYNSIPFRKIVLIRKQIKIVGGRSCQGPPKLSRIYAKGKQWLKGLFTDFKPAQEYGLL